MVGWHAHWHQHDALIPDANNSSTKLLRHEMTSPEMTKKQTFFLPICIVCGVIFLNLFSLSKFTGLRLHTLSFIMKMAHVNKTHPDQLINFSSAMK